MNKEKILSLTEDLHEAQRTMVFEAYSERRRHNRKLDFALLFAEILAIVLVGAGFGTNVAPIYKAGSILAVLAPLLWTLLRRGTKIEKLAAEDMELLLETGLPNLYYRGKVRDTYDLGDRLLIIATDRISAFDSVLPCGIPDKGIVLNQLSAFWFEKTAHLVPNHLIAVVDDAQWLNNTYGEKVCSGYYSFPDYVARRSMVVRKAERIDIECVVRGYISGSAWAEYQEKGSISGAPFPEGLVESEKLPEPIFTPTTKAASGHDEPLTIDEMKRLLGEARTRELVERSMAIYRYAHDYALQRGIIIADTKMEFGLVNDEVILIDELLTPDSSRFWDASLYQAGRSQPSLDKQPVRDWLIDSGWDKEPPAPMLPPDVIEQTTLRYREAYRRLVGKELQDGGRQ